MKRAVTGLHAWIIQRVSAVYMLCFIVFLFVHFLLDPPKSYLAWYAWMKSPGVSIGALVFCVALLMHTWVGIRDVILDYVQPMAMRILMLGLLGLGLIRLGAWFIRVLLSR